MPGISTSFWVSQNLLCEVGNSAGKQLMPNLLFNITVRCTLVVRSLQFVVYNHQYAGDIDFQS